MSLKRRDNTHTEARKREEFYKAKNRKKGQKRKATMSTENKDSPAADLWEVAYQNVPCVGKKKERENRFH